MNTRSQSGPSRCSGAEPKRPAAGHSVRPERQRLGRALVARSLQVAPGPSRSGLQRVASISITLCVCGPLSTHCGHFRLRVIPTNVVAERADAGHRLRCYIRGCSCRMCTCGRASRRCSYRMCPRSCHIRRGSCRMCRCRPSASRPHPGTQLSNVATRLLQTVAFSAIGARSVAPFIFKEHSEDCSGAEPKWPVAGHSVGPETTTSIVFQVASARRRVPRGGVVAAVALRCPCGF